MTTTHLGLGNIPRDFPPSPTGLPHHPKRMVGFTVTNSEKDSSKNATNETTTKIKNLKTFVFSG